MGSNKKRIQVDYSILSQALNMLAWSREMILKQVDVDVGKHTCVLKPLVHSVDENILEFFNLDLSALWP